MIIIILLALSQTAASRAQTSLLESRYATLSRIIDRAREITPFIDDTTMQRMMVEALDGMSITSTSKGMYSLIDTKKFFLVSMLAEEMPGYDSSNTFGFTLMEFDAMQFERDGRVVIAVNANIDFLSRNLDVNATALLHELYHAIQANGQLKIGYPMSRFARDTVLQFEIEKQAWRFQLALFEDLYPGLFRGLRADCDNLVFLNLYTDEQRRLLNKATGESMVRSLAFYAVCGEEYLKRLYIYK